MYAKILRIFLILTIMLPSAGCVKAETEADPDKQFAASLNDVKAKIENNELQPALQQLGEIVATNEELMDKLKSYTELVGSISAAPGSRSFRQKLLNGPLPNLTRNELRAVYLYPVLTSEMLGVAETCLLLPMLYFGALKGYAMAQYEIGSFLSRGEVCGWPRDLDESIYWYARAGEQGHIDAQINQAVAMLYGIGTSQDFAAGSELLMKNAADGNNPRAQYLLGRLMADGGVVKKDEDTALAWLRKASDQDYAPAQVRLGMMLWERAERPPQWDEARNWLRKAAEQGYAEGQYQLAKTHRAGISGDHWLFPESMKLYEAAARQGHVQAQADLGLSYWHGDMRTNTMKPDYDKAFKWLTKGAEGGDARAQLYLGYAYNEGKGVERDQVTGARWIRKAAEQGYALAEEALGYAYENGRGVPKNLREAKKWFTRAKNRGSWSAGHKLGDSKFEQISKQDAGIAIFLGLLAIGVLSAASGPSAGGSAETSRGCYTTFGTFQQTCDRTTDALWAGAQLGLW